MALKNFLFLFLLISATYSSLILQKIPIIPDWIPQPVCLAGGRPCFKFRCCFEYYNIGCKIYNQQIRKCKQCRPYWRNIEGKCRSQNYCKTHDETNGNCTSCRNEQYLVDSKCLSLPQQNELCLIRNESNSSKQCLKCKQFWTLKNAKCIRNPLCKTFEKSGDCIACIQGYNLTDKKCEKFPQIPQESQNNKTDYTNRSCNVNRFQDFQRQRCCVWDYQKQLCLQCRDFWILEQGKCISTPNCKRDDQFDGSCMMCQKGYKSVGMFKNQNQTQNIPSIQRIWGTICVLIQQSESKNPK